MSVIFDDKRKFFLNLKNKLPANSVVIQLFDKDSNHLAFIACHHEQRFSPDDFDNDREQSHFLEEISNFEAEILDAYFQIDKDTEKKFGGWTGELIITGETSEIIYHSKPASDGWQSHR